MLFFRWEVIFQCLATILMLSPLEQWVVQVQLSSRYNLDWKVIFCILPSFKNCVLIIQKHFCQSFLWLLSEQNYQRRVFTSDSCGIPIKKLKCKFLYETKWSYNGFCRLLFIVYRILNEKNHRWESGGKNCVSQKGANICAVIRVLKTDLFIDLSRLQHPSCSSTLYYRHAAEKQLSVSLNHPHCSLWTCILVSW